MPSSFLGMWERYFPTLVPVAPATDVLEDFAGPGTLYAPYIDASDFDDAAKALFTMSEFIADTAVPLEAAKEIARRDMTKRFETQTGPNGRAWTELSEKYEIQKDQMGYGDEPILVMKGDLKREALSEGAWSVSGDSVWFNTDQLPEYWAAHQYGSSHVTLDKGNNDISLTNAETGQFVELFAGIPPRPFIGLSNEAEGEILAIMDGWVDSGMATAVEHFSVGSSMMVGGELGTVIGSTSKGQAMVRIPGKGMRFGSKL